MTAHQGNPVVVTTAHRGVFFGYAEGDSGGKTIELTGARMCVYWPASVRGVLGLAATGPAEGSSVTPDVPRLVLQDVTAVMDVTPGAEKAWLASPWS